MLALNGRLSSRRIAQKFLARHQSTATATAKDTESIQIPRRIERGPTDILKALASTVGRDLTAAHYKYHDDPFFLPTSNMTKRSFALSQEAGRQAALWIRQEHRNLYDHRVADPVIQDFLPRAVYDENSKVTEETLQHVIKNGQLSDAITIYNLLNKDSVSLETKQALFELLCFTNNRESLDDNFPEKRWFTKFSSERKSRWGSNQLTEELFDLLKNENDAVANAAYNSLICGYAKFIEIDKAWKLYKECLEKGLLLDVRTFNSILSLVRYLKEDDESRRQLIIDILQTMVQREVHPNLGTLNSTLHVIQPMRSHHLGRELALSIYTEMTSAGVEPSLGTYGYLLWIFCRRTGPPSNILINILDKIDGKEFEIKDYQDFYFFTSAMEVARNHLINPDVAHRIHRLLLTGNNCNFIVDNHMESMYYRHYLTLIVQTQPLNRFMALYDSLVPNTYIPEPDVMDAILQAIELAGAEEGNNYLPRIWSHMVMFDHVQRASLTTFVLQIIYDQCPAPESPVNKLYADIAWHIWNFIQEQKERYRSKPLTLDGKMIGQIAVLLKRGGYFDKMLEVLSYLKEKEGTHPDLLLQQDLDIMLDACIENGHAPAAVYLVGYAVANEFPDATEMGYKVAQSLSLNSVEETKLVNLVGSEVLQSKEN